MFDFFNIDKGDRDIKSNYNSINANANNQSTISKNKGQFPQFKMKSSVNKG